MSAGVRLGALAVTVAQLVRALDCDSRGRGFDPRQSPIAPARRKCGLVRFRLMCGTAAGGVEPSRLGARSSAVEHPAFNRLVDSSILSGRINLHFT